MISIVVQRLTNDNTWSTYNYEEQTPSDARILENLSIDSL